MILKVYTIYDVCVKAYLQPFFCATKGQAIRSFTEAVNDKTTSISKYPSEYILFELGEYDDNSGLFLCGSPLHIGVGIEFLDRAKAAVPDDGRVNPKPVPRSDVSGAFDLVSNGAGTPS